MGVEEQVRGLKKDDHGMHPTAVEDEGLRSYTVARYPQKQ